MARLPPRLPLGNDPRLKIDPDDLDAASTHAMPQVARAPGIGDGLGMAAAVVGIAALGLITFVSLHGAKKPAQPPVVHAPVQPPAPVMLTPAPVQPPTPTLLTPPPIVQPMPPVTPAVVTDPNAARAPALIIDNSTPEVVPPSQAGPTSPAAGSKSLNANDQFIASVNGQITQKATKIGDPSKVVPQGAVIPAVLETAINSDLPGYTRAIVSRDIRSFDGTAVLIPRGSRLVGQYKSGLTSGETRAFIIWDRLIRPDGVSVQLASPATDELGQAGTSGSVDNHFVQRFGASILLSVVNGLAGGLAKSSSTIVIGTSSDAQSVASQALQANVAIPPTIKVPQGTPIQVFAARDLDFNLGQ